MRQRRSDLQELIQSLDTTEVRYCLAQIEQVQSKHRQRLQQLFTGLRNASEVDEKALKSSLQRQNPGWDFAHYKVLLAALVQQSLISYRKSSTVETRLLHMLESEKVLFGKNQFRQCSRLLDEARGLAELYQYPLLEFEILKRQGSLLNELFPDNFEVELKKIAERRIELNRFITNETEYRNLCHLLVLLHRKYYLCRSPELKERLLQLRNHPLLNDPEAALNFRSQRFYNNANAILCQLLGNFEQGIIYLEKNYHLWLEHPLQRSEKPIAYRGSLEHLCNGYIELNQFDKAKNILQEARKITVYGSTENARWFRAIKLIELVLCLNTADFAAMPALLNEIKKGLQLYSLPESYALSIIHNASVCCFVTEEYKQALKWLKLINDYNKSGERQDIRDFGLLFTLILWYCTKKFDLVENYLRSAKHFYTKQNLLYPIESLTIIYLPRLMSASKEIEKQQAAKEFLTALTNLKSTSLGTAELQLWLQSLVEGKPMRKLIIA
jgi:hypothetical protein